MVYCEMERAKDDGDGDRSVGCDNVAERVARQSHNRDKMVASSACRLTVLSAGIIGLGQNSVNAAILGAETPPFPTADFTGPDWQRSIQLGR